jgi:hypothetical protein
MRDARELLDRRRPTPASEVERLVRSSIARALGEGPLRVLRCAACRSAVTSTDEAIEVLGSHRHVRKNPAGFVFEIGCFRDAHGCTAEGHGSEEWSWFPGYLWHVALCAACGRHLGWVFVLAPARFYGLILERLVLDERDPS